VALWIYEKCRLLKIRALEGEAKGRELEACRKHIYALDRKLNEVESRIYPALHRLVQVASVPAEYGDIVRLEITLSAEVLMSPEKQLIAQYVGAEVAKQVACTVLLPTRGGYQ